MSGAIVTWVDGVEDDRIPADDRGLQYGDGLFETIVIRAGVARFLEAHLTRLAHGCARLALPFEDWEALRAEVTRAVARAPTPAILKILVTRGSPSRRGYAPPEKSMPRRIVTLWPTPPTVEADGGVTLGIASFRASENPVLAGLKHLNRLENVLAAAEASAQSVFDVLLLDATDQIVGGAMSNVFLVRGGRITTPIVSRAGVAGVMRGIVLREARALGISVDQQQIPIGEIERADEMFITNARIGVVPVLAVGEHRFSMGGITRRLREHCEALDA